LSFCYVLSTVLCVPQTLSLESDPNKIAPKDYG